MYLLPALLRRMQSTSCGVDERLLCLRSFIDITSHYLSVPEIYDTSQLQATPSDQVATVPPNTLASTRKLNEVIENHLLPQCIGILTDADPIPMYPLWQSTDSIRQMLQVAT